MTSTHAAAAQAIRKELKKNGIAATVRAKSYSGGDSVTVSLLNDELPATVNKVESFCNQFQQGHFDGMYDIYEYSNRRDDLPQVRFVFVNIQYSDEIRQAAWDWIKGYWSDMEDAPESFTEAQSFRAESHYKWGDQMISDALSDKRTGGFWNTRKQRIAA